MGQALRSKLQLSQESNHSELTDQLLKKYPELESSIKRKLRPMDAIHNEIFYKRFKTAHDLIQKNNVTIKQLISSYMPDRGRWDREYEQSGREIENLVEDLDFVKQICSDPDLLKKYYRNLMNQALEKGTSKEILQYLIEKIMVEKLDFTFYIIPPLDAKLPLIKYLFEELPDKIKSMPEEDKAKFNMDYLEHLDQTYIMNMAIRRKQIDLITYLIKEAPEKHRISYETFISCLIEEHKISKATRYSTENAYRDFLSFVTNILFDSHLRNMPRKGIYDLIVLMWAMGPRPELHAEEEEFILTKKIIQDSDCFDILNHGYALRPMPSVHQSDQLLLNRFYVGYKDGTLHYAMRGSDQIGFGGAIKIKGSKLEGKGIDFSSNLVENLRPFLGDLLEITSAPERGHTLIQDRGLVQELLETVFIKQAIKRDDQDLVNRLIPPSIRNNVSFDFDVQDINSNVTADHFFNIIKFVLHQEKDSDDFNEEKWLEKMFTAFVSCVVSNIGLWRPPRGTDPVHKEYKDALKNFLKEKLHIILPQLRPPEISEEEEGTHSPYKRLG